MQLRTPAAFALSFPGRKAEACRAPGQQIIAASFSAVTAIRRIEISHASPRQCFRMAQ